jgi:hypothetical protein
MCPRGPFFSPLSSLCRHASPPRVSFVSSSTLIFTFNQQQLRTVTVTASEKTAPDFKFSLSKDVVIAMSSDQALLAMCAICRKGPSCDRVLLCCGSQACTSGSWFHSDCIGPAIVSRNVKKSQRHWLCPWCVLNQISTLSERQLLALTLQISHLDSLRCSVTRSAEHSSDLGFSIDTLTPEPSSCSTLCPSMQTPPPPSSTNKKRSVVARSDSYCPLPDVADAEFSRTCAKCRRTNPFSFGFVGFDVLHDSHFRSASSSQRHASSKAN